MNLVAQQTIPQPEVRPRSRIGLAVAALFVVFPAVPFYIVLFRTALDIPFCDDYGGIEWVIHLEGLSGSAAKLSFLFESQVNEYKLVFAEAVVWLQVALMGHIDFKLLSAVSNAFVLLIALLLWKMFLPARKDLGLRLALFIPVTWLLFQFEYQELLNWGGVGLQHLPSLLFAFAAIYLLFGKTRRAFWGALAFHVLAVAASTNGFLLLPIGLLVLVPGRRYARIALWLATSAGCVVVYSYHYNVMSSKSSQDHSVISALLHMRPLYAISFIGSAAGPAFHVVSFVLGTLLCIFFFWMARRGYIRRSPAVSCCVLFLLLTAIGVAGIRSDMGLIQSVSSRYTIYSALFLIFAWFAIVEEFLQHSRVPLLDNGMYLGAVAASVFFCILMDATGYIQMKNWDERVVEGMVEFEHPNPPGSTKGPVISLWKGDDDRERSNPSARAALIESIKLGVYRPPKY
jgi:hypothetical protein